MKRISQLILCIALTGIISEAADLITKSGQVYKNFEVVKVKEDGLQIFHDSGSTSIPFAELPDDLRKKYREEEKHFSSLARKEREKRTIDSCLEKISLRNDLQVRKIQGNRVICEYYDYRGEWHYCIVEDVPEVNNLATKEYLKPNRPAVNNTIHRKHHYTISSRTEIQGEYVPSPQKNTLGRYVRYRVTYYSAHCNGCRTTIPQKTSRDAIATMVASLNQKTCLSETDYTPSHLVVYDTGRLEQSGIWGRIRVYTYSRDRAIQIIRLRPNPLSSITLTGKFDGNGRFIIQNDRIIYTHGGRDRPQKVRINGTEWNDLNQPFQLTGWFEPSKVSAEKRKGRDKVEYRIQNGTGVLQIDNGPNGADRYEVIIK